ncbi:OsmC family protein [Marivirga sp. S37H4]|uniref:OsmC family protein n=1 Tax=Marivirga aurantiaca TaxID=2802615 RepID=A0A934X1Z8_9BACT|nr:bifunctional alpha/beta hydrolase/OsmC family protein [Marivirga aurantiaca]MBK6266910.1 OsmC family protein [Marivirga aurantiaca]
MKREKISFKGAQGHKLAAYIAFPADRKPINYVIFAHCFTCNKNLNAVRNISFALTKYGYAVMSFDFTGLGESEGDFSNTDFSSNTEDLIAASAFLKSEYKPPSLLIGHSLGGAAVLMAASKIGSVKAIATIGAPAQPDHILRLIKDGIDEIKEKGEAEVSIGGRPFKIKEQFLNDLKDNKALENLKDLRKPILILHSPQDNIVGIENAEEIYKNAFHPKSFISLDGADHLISNKDDSNHAGEMIAIWAKKYVEKLPDSNLSTDSQTVALIGPKEDNYTTQLVAEGHHLLADEPEDVGGDNFGPTPYGFLTSALAACTAITLRMYANRKKWNVEEVLVHVDQEHRHEKDSENCESEDGKITYFSRKIEIKGNLDDKQRKKLLEIAEKCPVHKTLESPIKVESELLTS